MNGKMSESRLSENRRLFEVGIRRLNEISDAEAGLYLAYWLMSFAQDSGCGYFASSEIEKRLREFAKRLAPPKDAEVTPQTVLMVMTEAYMIGGHTRVVERWIEQDQSRCYSLVLTDHRAIGQVPGRLKDAVARSGGRLFLLDVHESRMERAQKLRDLAAAFEKIVLHIHMHDVISFVAFGSDAFPRPVGFYNHADHVPWIGVSISDCVAEIRAFGAALSHECRGVRESVIVGIPSDTRGSEAETHQGEAKACDVRVKYGIKPDVSLLLTCGREIKYQPVAGLDFLDVVRGILSRDKEAVVLAIGPTLSGVPGWRETSRAFNGRLKAIGSVPFDQMPAFYKEADIFLDSYPLGGSTTIADALKEGAPVLSVPGPMGQDDWVYRTKGHCASLSEMTWKALLLIRDRERAKAYARIDLSVYRDMQAPTRFRERVEAFFDRLNAPHQIHPFMEKVGLRPELDRFLWEQSQSSKEVICEIPHFLTLWRCRSPLARRRVLTLFGHDFVIRKRWTSVGKMVRDLEAFDRSTKKEENFY